jgi:hypothetical protein
MHATCRSMWHMLHHMDSREPSAVPFDWLARTSIHGSLAHNKSNIIRYY